MKDNKISFEIPAQGLADFIQSKISEALMEARRSAAPMPDFVSQKELSGRIGLSVPTIIKLRKEGKIAGVLVGNKWRYEVSEVWRALRMASGHEGDNSRSRNHRAL